MKVVSLSIILLGLFIILPLSVAWGQTSRIYTGDEQSGFEMMNDVKDDIDGLMAENARLEEEFKPLQAKYDELKAQYDQLKAQFGEPEHPQDSPTVDHDAPLAEGAFDSPESMDLLELKLADLQYEKRSLELQMKAQDPDDLNDGLRSANELEELRLDMEENLRVENALVAIRAEILEASELSPLDIQRMQKEIPRMQSQLEELVQKIDIQQKQLAILQDKKTLAVKQREVDFAGKDSEKTLLAQEVEQLELKYNDMNRKVEAALKFQESKEEVIRDIVKFDKENQALKEQIEEKRKKNDLKP